MPARREDTDRLPAILGLDHVMVMVGDLDAASAEAENAGFTLSSPSVMPGLVNRLICFADAPPGAASFIEFLQIADKAQVPQAVLEVLGERLGPAAIVVAVDDMARYCAHLDTIGIGHSGPMSIRRQWPVGEGGTLDVHLEVVLPDPAELPVPCVAVRHHTPHHYRRREFVTHANAMVAMPASCHCPGAGSGRRGSGFRQTGRHPAYGSAGWLHTGNGRHLHRHSEWPAGHCRGLCFRNRQSRFSRSCDAIFLGTFPNAFGTADCAV